MKTLHCLAVGLQVGFAFGLYAAQTSVAVPPTATAVTPVETLPAEGSAAQAAQLQREHLRAVAADDPDNDPLDSSSSDALNRRSLAASLSPVSPETSAPASQTPPSSGPGTDHSTRPGIPDSSHQTAPDTP